MFKTRLITEKEIMWRRIIIFGLVFLTTAYLTFKWTLFMPSKSSMSVKVILTLLYMLTTAWITMFFWSSVFGFFELLFRKNQAGLKWPEKNMTLTTKTAVLMPIYNEDPEKVFANVVAIAQTIEQAGQGKAYDFYVLSDTNKPKIWVEEENTWANARKLMPKEINLYYRRRSINVARKSGNIEDFCHKWGSLYDYMVVLDADSLLVGETIIKMSQLMEINENAGIIQVPPVCINSKSLFSRIQQYAGKVYGPIVAAGSCYWQVHDSNYWGHNAIIRVQAFINCCGLPVLKGPKPFGGYILSHDFVEAALIRRGGWYTWLVPELSGSYEECPPSMLDFTIRDRRWCQGNMQHLKILFSRHIHHISRVHFTIGIMSYLSSLLWFLFLISGMFVALGRIYFPPEYFPTEETLFPNWPIFNKMGTIILFAISMFMLIFPKFLGLIIYIKNYKSKDIGGFFGAIKSFVFEILFSTLIAPVMMVSQSKIVWEIFSGHDSGWSTQNRDGHTQWKTAFKKYCGHTLLGIFASVVVYYELNPLFYWILPITVGLIFSIPIVALSSYEKIGLASLKRKCFVIPEEINIPRVASLSKRIYSIFKKDKKSQGVLELIKDSYLLEIHTFMLKTNGPAPEFGRSVQNEARIKLHNFIHYGKIPDFTPDEEISLLYDSDILHEAHTMHFIYG